MCVFSVYVFYMCVSSVYVFCVCVAFVYVFRICKSSVCFSYVWVFLLMCKFIIYFMFFYVAYVFFFIFYLCVSIRFLYVSVCDFFFVQYYISIQFTLSVFIRSFVSLKKSFTHPLPTIDDRVSRTSFVRTLFCVVLWFCTDVLIFFFWKFYECFATVLMILYEKNYFLKFWGFFIIFLFIFSTDVRYL